MQRSIGYLLLHWGTTSLPSTLDVRGIRLEHKISHTNVPFLSYKKTVFKAVLAEEIASFPAEKKALLETQMSSLITIV